MSWKVIVCLVLSLVRASAEAPCTTEQLVAPAVPAGLEVPEPYQPYFRAHAIGTQNYICAPAATTSGFDWLFIGPQATLFDDGGDQRATHFQSLNVFQADAIQATWQDSRDSSVVWATKDSGSTDPLYVAPGAIEWLRLAVTGTAFGPQGGGRLARTGFIQRVNTAGGIKPPASQCTSATLNSRRLVPYQADYYFYR